MFKKLWRTIGPNSLDVLLKKAKSENKNKVLITWNRGLGDIALGLYGLTSRIREFLPNAEITFLTRSDLKDGFTLIQNVRSLVGSTWKRGTPFNLSDSLAEHHLKPSDFDLILENPDPTNWLHWQLGKIVPKLEWKYSWDHLHDRFNLPQDCLGVHVQTETVYGYEKNWPITQWQAFFRSFGKPVVLFGFKRDSNFEMENVYDLRGQTSLHEMLSIIKNRCTKLLVPDSGVLSLIYYIDVSFPIHIVSLWADPRQGILKHGVPSPNPYLSHVPLLGKDENIATISIDEVMKALC